MTRETKIGLLVGLAFIIVIGILLSDHLTSATEPPQARLTNAGSSVRQGISVPGGSTAAPPITHVPQQIREANVTPIAPVPTPQELTPRPQPQQIVQVGPGGSSGSQSGGPIRIEPAMAPETMSTAAATGPFGQPVTAFEPPITQAYEPAVPLGEVAATPQPDHQPGDPVVIQTPQVHDPALVALAQQHGEALANVTPERTATSSAPTRSTGTREYVAQDGDSLSKMASRLMGGNTRANRDAIVRANPSLKKNPDLVIVGQTYVIPASADAAPAAAAAVARNAEPTPAAPARDDLYTVKSGDTLWGIAKDQVGTPAAVAAIKELNKDVLKGSDTVRVGMKLRLPARSVASAE